MDMKINKYKAGYMTRMAAMLVYGKIPLKVLYPWNQRNDYKDT